jgi:hypothetical protein
LRSNGRLAPKTIRNVYGTLHTLFRDALLKELMTIDPCVLPRGALPSPRENVAVRDAQESRASSRARRFGCC